MHVVWARGQQAGDIVHHPDSAIEAGHMDDAEYYKLVICMWILEDSNSHPLVGLLDTITLLKIHGSLRTKFWSSNPANIT